MKKAKKALALFLCAIMLFSSLYVGGSLGFWGDTLRASATESSNPLEHIQSPNSVRLKLNFNKNWKFHLNEAVGAYAREFNDKSWRVVNLPHDFSIEQTFRTSGTEVESGNLPNGIGWYRKSFIMPEDYKDKSVVLTFDGSYSYTEVFVNGRKAGVNRYGYNSFSIDIAKDLIFDGKTKNTVAVKVVAEFPSSRWYSGAGISRDVTMLITDKLHVSLDGIHSTMPELKASYGANGELNTVVTVYNGSNAQRDYKVRTTLYNKDGKIVSAAVSEPQRLSSNSGADITLKNRNAAPVLWNTDNPYLYTLRTEILTSDELTIIDTIDTKIGYRWTNWDKNNGFSLNNVNTKIKGVCLHHDQGALGAAQEYDALYRQIMILKDMGVNAVRSSHNVASRVLIDVCNETGMMVMEEFFDGWNKAKNGNSQDFAKDFYKAVDTGLIGAKPKMTCPEFVVRSTVKRDRNDPCVIIWSAGNELQEGIPNGQWVDETIAPKLRSWVRSLDDTRELTFGNNIKGNALTLANITKHMDVVGGNYNKDHWNSRPNSNKPFIGTETASSVNSRGEYNAEQSGIGNGVRHANNSIKTINSYDDSYVSWGNAAADTWNNVITQDWNSGEFVWTGFDYIGEPTPWNSDTSGNLLPNSSYFGIIDTAGFGKDSYYLYRSMWNEKSHTLHLLPGTWNQNELTLKGGFVDVAVYTDADEVQILLNNEVVGKATATVKTTNAGYAYKTWKEESTVAEKCKIDSPVYTGGGADLYPQFQVKYEQGTLSVKAFKNGEEITNVAAGTKEVKNGTAAKIVANVWDDKTTLTADGAHLAYIELEAQDSEGRFFNDYNGKINFTISSNAKIVGVDNGYQGTTRKFQNTEVLSLDKKTANIDMFNGKAVVIVESTEEVGSITLNITAQDNLPVIGNTSKLLRGNVADGKITLNAVQEVNTQVSDEFEEIIPQITEYEYVVEGAPEPNGWIMAVSGPYDKVYFKYPTDIYLDISESLQGVGYKAMVVGGNGNPHSHYGDSSDFRIGVYKSALGLPEKGTKNNVLYAEAFDGYSMNVYSDPSGRTIFPDGAKGYPGWAVRPAENGSGKIYPNMVFAFQGTPKLGTAGQNFRYSTDNNVPLFYCQTWSFWGYWNVPQHSWVTNRNDSLLSGNPDKDIVMNVHIYDKSPLKTVVNLEMLKAKNEAYKNLIVKGNWEDFSASFTPADLDQSKLLLTKREISQNQIDAEYNQNKDSIDKANALVFKAPDTSKNVLEDEIKRAEALINSRDYVKKYTKESRDLLERKLAEAKGSKYLKPNGLNEYKVNMNDPATFDAGYNAYKEITAIENLAEGLRNAIAALKPENRMKVNATIFKYGYNNTVEGDARYYDGGYYMNEITMKSLDKKLQARRDEIGTILDGIVGGHDKWNNDMGARDAEIDDAIANYKNLYSLAFTDSAVNNSGRNVQNFYRSAWNIWCKTGTQAPGEGTEQGASIQGLASSTLLKNPDGTGYFTSHAPYDAISYINNTTLGEPRTTQKYRIDGAGKHEYLYLPTLPGMSVESSDLFKKEALTTDGRVTTETRGNFAKYYWDTEFPLAVTTVNGVNHYQFDSKSNEYLLQAKFDDANHKAEMNLTKTNANWRLNVPDGLPNRGFFPFNFQENSNINQAQNAIYHYGLTFNTDFYIPKEGQYTEGQDIIFDFTGDDDVYVYIDDVLVLDNGGLHGARKSSINFTDCSVSYQYVQNVDEDSIKTGPKPIPNSDDIVYKYGEANEGISKDNSAALEKLNKVRSDGDSHTLTFFFLERGSGSSNCDINFNVKETSRDIKLNNQDYVIDYAIDGEADFKENDYKSDYAKDATIEYLGVTSPNTELAHDTIIFNQEEATTLFVPFNKLGTVSFETNNSTYKINKNGKIDYTAKDMNFAKPEYFYIVSKITNDPSFGEGTSYYRYEKVTFVPATSIYYEDNKAITYTNGTVKGGVEDINSGTWSPLGNSSSPNEVKQPLSSVAEKIYGASPVYQKFNDYSAGSAQKVTVSAKNNPNPKFSGGSGAKWPKAEFTFTGTGFDLISMTNNTTGAFDVVVTNADTNKMVTSRVVDTYYGYSYGRLYMTPAGEVVFEAQGNTVVYNSIGGKYTTTPTHYENGKVVMGEGENPAYAYGWLEDESKTDSLYQIPVIKVEDLDYATYNVTITPKYTKMFGHGRTNYDFILDAIRVYDPAGKDNLDPAIDSIYNEDKENHPVYLELNDKIVGSEVVGANTQNGVVMINGEALTSYDLKNYTKGMPNHEVYLSKNSAVTFELYASTVPEDVQLAAKNVKGISKMTVLNGENTKSNDINTATDLYVSLNDVINLEWVKVEEGGETYYKTKPITIKNDGASDSVLSLTNLKLTFTKSSNAQINEKPQAKLMVNERTVMYAIRNINMFSADLKVNKAAEPQISNARRDKSDVTFKLRTSIDVDRLIVRDENGVIVTATATYTVNNNVKEWTVKVSDVNVGKHTFTFEGVYDNGYTNDVDPLEITFTVAKKPFNIFRAISKSIRDFFVKIFG